MGSCDVIEGSPYKDTVVDTNTTEAVRNVFIEDFTGHRCNNCPDASQVIKDLEGLYGDRIIGLAIHAGPGSFTNVLLPDYPTDFTTPEGKQLQNFFDPMRLLPTGMVNREGYTGSGRDHMKAKEDWATLSAQSMDSTLRMDIEATATFKSDSTVEVEVSCEALTDLLHDVEIVALIKEDYIISPQLMPDGSRNANYVHMNVLRDHITDLWGENLAISPVVKGDEFAITLSPNEPSWKWDPVWVQSNSTVVVYVYNPDNYQVLQAVEVPIN